MTVRKSMEIPNQLSQTETGINTTGATKVLLLGDSTVITTYLPEEQRYQQAFERELKIVKPEVIFEIFNAADNGEFIGRFLLSGAYERMLAATQGADIIAARFGANDEKRISPEEYEAHLEKLLDLLEEDFPGTGIFLETGVYMDPEHYLEDRNKTLRPYWQKVREIARRRNLRLSDVYAAMERETAQGNWDLRIRKTDAQGIRTLDSSRDAGREKDKAWFTDIHPNAEGARVAARELARSLANVYAGEFPSGQRRIVRSAKSSAEYSSYLGFGPERLSALDNSPWRSLAKASLAMDDLQLATNQMEPTR